MYTEHYDNGDIRVTFTSKESYWDFLEVAEFKVAPWAHGLSIFTSVQRFN